MRLLIITQKVDKNDDVLGFFHGWIHEFAKHCEQVLVVCLEKGEYDLSENVRVLSLGKEEGVSRAKYLFRFYRYIWNERKNYDVVFVHMNQIYVLLGGFFWRIIGVRVGLWYIHRAKTLSLWIAEKFANVIFTATSESFQIKSTKLHFMGQAIDIEKFRRTIIKTTKDKPFRIVSVGRITAIKNLDTLVRATKILKDRGYELLVELVGTTVTRQDEMYKIALHELVSALKLQAEVSFVGSIPNNQIASHYWNNHLSLNLCPTGGMDKAVLESMAAGTPAIVSNEAFRDYFGVHADELIFKFRNEVDCANKIEAYIKNEDKESLRKFLFEKTAEKSTLGSLIKQIVRVLAESRD